jgi:hypothetical protein
MPGKRKNNTGILYVSSVPKPLLDWLDSEAEARGGRTRRGDVVCEILSGAHALAEKRAARRVAS